jgi:hypothetical protein
MPQLHLPLFPDGVTHITDQWAFMKKDGQITYFNGHMPVFGRAEHDVATFRVARASLSRAIVGVRLGTDHQSVLRQWLCAANGYHPDLRGDVD